MDGTLAAYFVTQKNAPASRKRHREGKKNTGAGTFCFASTLETSYVSCVLCVFTASTTGASVAPRSARMTALGDKTLKNDTKAGKAHLIDGHLRSDGHRLGAGHLAVQEPVEVVAGRTVDQSTERTCAVKRSKQRITEAIR